MTLIFLTFFAGLLTILAPCALPLLPIVLAGSIGEKSHTRPFLITLGLAVSIVIFTVLLKVTTLFLFIPHIFWVRFSGTLLVALGLIYIFPGVWLKLSLKLGLTNSQKLLQKTQNIHNFSLQSFLTGAALGPVFSSCSPTYAFLLATVFPVSILKGIFLTFSYALGLSSILFLIAWGGQSVVKKLKFFANEKGIFKKILGSIIILMGVAIIFGFDKQLEVIVVNSCNLGSIEQTFFDTLKP